MPIVKVAGNEHASLIAKLSRETFFESFAADNTKEDMELFMNTQFTQQMLEKEVEDPVNHFFIAWEDDRPVGYMKLKEHPEGHPDFVTELPAIELNRIYAVKDFIGKGVGKLLMNKAIDKAMDWGNIWIWLGVWEKNERAIHFYEKNGFQKSGSHTFLLGTDLQTDLLMARKLG
jgi:GNAT superfamily N-acetyltransferase